MKAKSFPSVILFLLVLWCQTVSASELYELSLEKSSLPKGERITGFKVSIDSGRVYSIPRLPEGWNIVVENDPSWCTNIQGRFLGNDAVVERPGKEFPMGFLIIEKLQEQKVSHDVPFRVTVSLFIDDGREMERTLTLSGEALGLRKL
jgi:hypothetical protein